jgi:preprotein translocase subunit SecE
MTHHIATTKRSRSRFRFIGEIISELRKVVWLTRREAMYLTFLVLVVSIVMGLILGVFDYGFARLVNDLFLGR